jgi:hypothetical protein
MWTPSGTTAQRHHNHTCQQFNLHNILLNQIGPLAIEDSTVKHQQHGDQILLEKSTIAVCSDGGRAMRSLLRSQAA